MCGHMLEEFFPFDYQRLYHAPFIPSGLTTRQAFVRRLVSSVDDFPIMMNVDREGSAHRFARQEAWVGTE
jgi:hypothetical protein